MSKPWSSNDPSGLPEAEFLSRSGEPDQDGFNGSVFLLVLVVVLVIVSALSMPWGA